MSPPRKKAKREPTSATPTITHEQNNSPCHLLRLPLELLAEMLSYTHPPDLLSLARTSKYFCRTLCDPGSSIVWKRARMDHDSSFLVPDPPPNMPEPAYAAMIFDPGKCGICKKKTNRLHSSYACRFRVCAAPVCMRYWDHYALSPTTRDKFTTLVGEMEFLKTVFEESDESLLHVLALCGSVHLDPLETVECEASSLEATYLTEQLKPALQAFARKYFQAKGDPQAFDALMDTYAVQKETQSQRYQHLLELHAWARRYEERKKLVSREHLQSFQLFAAEHCLQMSDMQKSATFLRVKQLCLSRLDEPTDNVIGPYVDRIIEETDVIFEARKRHEQEKRLSTRRQDIKVYYKEYDAPILPNLQVFRRLPILDALQHNDGAESIQDDLKSDTITTSVRDQLEQWVKRTKDDIMKLLGYGRGKEFKEYRPQASKVHPLERATTLFQCKVCKRVSSVYGRMGVLDFKGLCLHECIQPEKSTADRTKWSTSNFELASNAIATARAALDALGRKEDKTSFTDLRSKWFLCKMCPYGVRDMVFEDLLRHCKRHPTQSVEHTGSTRRPQPQLQEPAKPLRSVAKLKSGKHEREVMRHQFACAHCRFRTTQTNATGAEQVEDPRRMDYNGLRSHLRARHEIHDVRNEDYYWLPWDESMESSMKEEFKKKKKKTKKPVYVSSLCSVTKTRCSHVHIAIPALHSTPPPPTTPEPEPMEEDSIPDTAYQPRKRRGHAKLHFCKHCPGGPMSSSTARGFDWQGLTLHMKARHLIDKPADAIDYEMRDRDQSPSCLGAA